MSADLEKETIGRRSTSKEDLSMANSFEKHSDVVDKDLQDIEKDKGRIEPSTDKASEPGSLEKDVDGGDLERHLSSKSSKKQRLEPEKFPLIDLENGLVGWDSQDDPANPKNFTARRKWFIIALLSAITFLNSLSSSIFAPAISFMSEDFHNTSQILGAFSVSIFVLGFAIGPLFLSSLSEIYGRRIVLSISSIFFCAFTLGCALSPNITCLLIMRCFAGIGGSASLTLGSGVIADLFPPQERGRAMSFYSAGILFGPVLGPIIGGFISQRAGWRWTFWVAFIVSVIISSGIVLLNRETYPVVLMEWKTRKLRKETGQPDLKNIYTHEKDSSTTSSRAILIQGLIRPLKLLFTSPIVFMLSLYMAFVFGLLFLLFTTITHVYVQTYGFSPEICGLTYLGIGLGNFAGIIFVAKTSDATIIRLTKRNKGNYEPEMRLPTCVFFGCLIPISLFWYGWSTENGVHWIVPIIGLFPFGLGMIGVFIPILTYVIDSFPLYAASASSGLTSFRCLFGAVLPLAAPRMYEALGLGWGNSLLGFIAVAMIPFPALIYKYGGYIRNRWPVTL